MACSSADWTNARRDESSSVDGGGTLWTPVSLYIERIRSLAGLPVAFKFVKRDNHFSEHLSHSAQNFDRAGALALPVYFILSFAKDGLIWTER